MTGPSSVPRGERTPRAAGRLAVAWSGEQLDTTTPGNEPVPPRLNRAQRRALERAARRTSSR